MEPHGRKRLEIRHTMSWNDVFVRLDGVDLGRTDRHTLYNGGIGFALRDGTMLHLALENDFRGYPMLCATRNGMPLPGTAGDPVSQIRGAAALMLVASVPQILVGWIMLNAVPPANGLPLIVAGIALLFLGLFSLAHSFPAMVIGSVVMGIETIVLMATKFTAADMINAWLLLMAVGWLMVRGIRGAHFIDHMRLPVRHPPRPFRRSR